MRITLIIFIAVVLGLALYVRLAPSDPSRWHVMPDDIENRDLEGGADRVIAAQDNDFGRLHEVALVTPRTRILAGSIEDGVITYVTRSRAFGFPDYTTVENTDGQIKIHARLRFGKSDMGVNAARVERWLTELGASGG